jgi:hypothetical protein
MEKNEKVARVHRALSWLYAIIAILVIVAGVLSHEKGAAGGIVFMLLFMGAFFLLHRATAAAAMECKPWARTVSFIIALLMLPGIPLGTMIGIYLLINLSGWDEEALV